MRLRGGFSVLRSSAGAGKTHALARRWLVLALSGADPTAYRRVLAITFTNKAARELRDRVLDRLHALAGGGTGDGGLHDIRATLKNEAGLEGAALQQRSAEVFRHVLHHWADLSITTIDAFTRRVVKPFARDLMLDGDLEMTTEVEEYHRRAVDRLLTEAGRDAQLTGFLEQVAFNLIEDAEKWRPDLRLLELSQELEKGGTIARLPELRKVELATLLGIEKEARRTSVIFRDQVRELGRTGLKAIEEHDIDLVELAHGRKGVVLFLNKLAAFSGRMDPIGVNARSVLEGGKWWSGKADDNAIRRIEAVRPVIEAVYARYLGMAKDFRTHAIRNAVIKGLLPTAALRAIDQRLEELKREEGVHFFNDLTRKASSDLQHEPPQFIFERIGERYQHLMIDEFQDTSLLQWAALLPLAENILGNGGSVQLVGDAKQAIYRWRDGEARLFSEFPELFERERFHDGERLEAALRSAYLRMPPLKDNFRSGRAIVHFNNRLFERMAAHLPDGTLRKIYEDPGQEPRSSFAGYVEISSFANDPSIRNADEGDPTADDRENIRRTAGVVRRCIDDGFRYGDIAVLVRSGNIARAIAEHFTDVGIPVFSNDALLLEKDPNVALVLDLLRFLHHGEAGAAARAAQRMGSLLDATAVEDPVGALRTWCRGHPSIAMHHPLDQLVVDIIAAVGASPVTDPYLMTLLDEVHAFTSAGAGDIGGFLEHWRGRGGQRAVRANGGADAVNLLTIHKSKGLEFPVVIVPDTTMRNKKDGNERVWIEPGDAVPGIASALVPMDRLHDLDVPEVMEVERLQALDELNLLYVAFTRAIERLYAFVPERKKIDDAFRRRDPFHAVLLDLVATEGTHGIFQAGDATGPVRESKDRIAPLPLAAAGDIAAPVRIALREEAPDGWDPADPDPHRSHGVLVHAIMAAVPCVDDLAPAIDRAVAVGECLPEAGRLLHERLKSILLSPEVMPFFRKGVGIRTEATLIDRNGHAHRPDRIVVDANGSHILDIKTGVPAAHHHDQVREYVRLLREVEGGAVSGHLLYLSTGTLTTVIGA